MSSWQMFEEFAITFFSIVGIIVIVYLIVKKASRETIEMEGLPDAEWLIRDYCNSQKNCNNCKRYNQLSKRCMYQDTIPGKWKSREDDG